MLNIINLITGRRFWYQVTLEYVSKDGRLLVTSSSRQVGVTTRSDILDRRTINKCFGSWASSLPRRVLCDGVLNVNVTAYLGWMRKPDKKKQRESIMDALSMGILCAYIANMDCKIAKFQINRRTNKYKEPTA